MYSTRWLPFTVHGSVHTTLYPTILPSLFGAFCVFCLSHSIVAIRLHSRELDPQYVFGKLHPARLSILLSCSYRLKDAVTFLDIL